MPNKVIALVAHDNKKNELVDWARHARPQLENCTLVATGTTGGVIMEALGLPVTCFQSGPLGGDQQIGAMIAENKVDYLVFFWDPLEPQPHDPDVKALLRLAVAWNIPVACNRATAEFIFTSPLFAQGYVRKTPDFSGYRNRLKK